MKHQRSTDPVPLPPETITLPSRGWRIDPFKAVSVGAICWTGFGIIAWLVHSGRTAMTDRAGLLLWRNEADHSLRGSTALLEAVRDITALGGTLILTTMVIAAVAALVFLKMRWEAVLLVLSVVSGTLTETMLKSLFGRARPEIVPHLTEAGGMSFPSGHSFNSALIYISIALAFATISARQSVRVTIISLALLVSALIATSRVWLGVHFPSDVAAGWLGGVGWAFVASALLFRPAKVVADSDTAQALDPVSE